MSGSTPPLKVLFFDVFGTCVAQRNPVADALSKAVQVALSASDSTMSDSVRAVAENMSYQQWFDFGGEWDKEVEKFVKVGKEKDNVDWRAVDDHRLVVFRRMLSERGLILSKAQIGGHELTVDTGSLWNRSQLDYLTSIWHRLPPWPDTCDGLRLLNKQFLTVTLSNTYNGMMEDIVSHSSIPFMHVFTADMFDSYKPNPKVYLGAAERLEVKPEECALVAAHLGDLKGAKACGFRTIYVKRPLEEKNPELEEDNIPELVIDEGQDGFIALAEVLTSRTSEDVTERALAEKA